MDKTCIIPSKQITTTESSRKGCQARQIKVKIITFHAHRSTPGYDQDI